MAQALLLVVMGFILGFFSCTLLWFYIESKNAKKRNEVEEVVEVELPKQI